MNRKTKLIRQILPAFLVIIVLSLSVVGSYLPGYFKKILIEEAEKELIIRAEILRHQFSELPLNTSGLPNYKNIYKNTYESDYKNIDKECQSIGEKTGTRVTVILPSGKVIGDSFTDVSIMENHADRPEIIAAMNLKQGTVTRYSATLEKDMMYAALPLIRNGSTIAVIRTSTSLVAMNKKLASIRNNTLLVILITIILAAAASFLVARQIIRPVREMKKVAQEFAQGNLIA